MGHGQPLRNKSTKVGASITPDFVTSYRSTKFFYFIRFFNVTKFVTNQVTK